MSIAAYGNHDDPKVGERASTDAASRRPEAGSTDRPGLDLGGATEASAASGAMGGGRSNPDTEGVGPHSGAKESTSPTLSDDESRHAATPGDGASSAGRQGDEVDPGVG